MGKIIHVGSQMRVTRTLKVFSLLVHKAGIIDSILLQPSLVTSPLSSVQIPY